LAIQYKNKELVLPEIFSKGVRNSWGLKVVEPFTPVVASGECGPDTPKPDGFTEQTNVVSKPGFHGWPIHMGIVDWKAYKGGQIRSLPGGTVYDSLAPRIENNSDIKGVRVLPPIVTPVYKWEYRRAAPKERVNGCGTGAAVYWYDGYSKSKRKFPPHFNGKLFATDHTAQWLRIVTLNKTLDTALSESEFFHPNKDIHYEKPVDVIFGPDGALYIIHFIGSWFKDNAKHHISRIEYKGDCRPELPKSPHRGCMDPKASNFDKRVRHGCPNNVCCDYSASIQAPKAETVFNIHLGTALSVSIKKSGQHSLRVLDINGKLIHSKHGQGAQAHKLSHMRPGLYLIHLKVDNRSYSQKVVVTSTI
jgi:hypothetical protein